ncbi:MAG: ATP-binding protein [Bdellovibrionota bacterium]
MVQLLKRIPEWGVRPEMPPHEANHLRLTNVLLMLMTCGSIVWTLVLAASGAVQAAVVNSSAPFVFAGGLLLMKWGFTKLARLFVITIAFTGGYVVCTVVGREAYFQFIFLFASAFSVIFFAREEKYLLGFSLLFALSCFAGLEVTDYRPFAGFERATLSVDSLLFMRLMSATLIWGLMVGHFGYFVKRRRISQEQLVSSSKMVAMGRMAAGIAHEVNNPLQRIVGHADRLKFMAASGSVAPDQISVLSEQIQVVAMRIASIVKGLLALSRDASNDPLEEVALSSVINLSLDYCRARLESHDVQLRVGEIPAQWTVLGRETQLSEVLLNVMSNAFDAAVESKEKWIQIEATLAGSMIEISVTDSGAGVKEDLRLKIFDPFFTTKPVGKGTGLGLSVSQGIMNVHGGHIALDSKSARTRFVITVPRGDDLTRPDIRQLDA